MSEIHEGQARDEHRQAPERHRLVVRLPVIASFRNTFQGRGVYAVLPRPVEQ
jgi:hypothetical protein